MQQLCAFIHMVQPIADSSMDDWLYYVRPFPVLLCIVQAMHSILTLFYLKTTKYAVTATATAASSHSHVDEHQQHRTQPKTA